MPEHTNIDERVRELEEWATRDTLLGMRTASAIADLASYVKDLEERLGPVIAAVDALKEAPNAP